MLIYLTVVPAVFAPTWRWATPAVMAFAAWALLGLEAAAVETERPMRECANHMPLDTFAAVVAENVAQTLRHSASMGKALRTARSPRLQADPPHRRWAPSHSCEIAPSRFA